MRNKKTIGVFYLIVGLVLFFVSVYGYQLGIARHESFGAFQWAGTIIGIVAAVWGASKLLESRQSET